MRAALHVGTMSGGGALLVGALLWTSLVAAALVEARNPEARNPRDASSEVETKRLARRILHPPNLEFDGFQRPTSPEGTTVLLENEGDRKASLIQEQSGIQYKVLNNKGNGTYEFGYDTRGGRTGARFFRHEEKGTDGRVRGQYGFVDANDDLHVIIYVTDALGHRIRTETHKIEGYGRELSRLLEQGSSSADVRDQINLLLEKHKEDPSSVSSSITSSITSSSTSGSTEPPATTAETFRSTRHTRLPPNFEPYFSDEEPEATTLRPTLRSLLRSTAFTTSSTRHATPRPLSRDLASAPVLTRPPTSRDDLNIDDVERLVSLLDNARARPTSNPRISDFSTPTSFLTNTATPPTSNFEDRLRELVRSTQAPERLNIGTVRPTQESLLPLALGIPVPLRKSLSQEQSAKLKDYLARILRGDDGDSGAIVLGRLNVNALRGSKMNDVLSSLGLLQSNFDDLIRDGEGDPLAVYFDPTAPRQPERLERVNTAQQTLSRTNDDFIDGGIIDGGIIDGGIIDGGIIGDDRRSFLRGSNNNNRPTVNLNRDEGKNLGGEYIDGGIIDGGIIGGTRNDGIIDGGIIDGGIIGGRISSRGRNSGRLLSGDIIDGGIIDGGIIDDRRIPTRLFDGGRRGKTIDPPSGRDFASQSRGTSSQEFGLTPPPQPPSTRPTSARPSSTRVPTSESVRDRASLIDQLIAFHKPEYPEDFDQRASLNSQSHPSRTQSFQLSGVSQEELSQRRNQQFSNDRFSGGLTGDRNPNGVQNLQFLNYDNDRLISQLTEASNRDKQLLSSGQNLGPVDNVQSDNQRPRVEDSNRPVDNLGEELRILLERLAAERQQSRPLPNTERQNGPNGDLSEDSLRQLLERLKQGNQEDRNVQNSENNNNNNNRSIEDDIKSLLERLGQNAGNQQSQGRDSDGQNRAIDSLSSIVDSLRAEMQQSFQDNDRQNNQNNNNLNDNLRRLAESLRGDRQQSGSNVVDRRLDDASDTQDPTFQNSNGQNRPNQNSGNLEQGNRFQNNDNVESNAQQFRPTQDSNPQNNQQPDSRNLQNADQRNNQQQNNNQAQAQIPDTFNERPQQDVQPVQNSNNNQQIQNNGASENTRVNNVQPVDLNNPEQNPTKIERFQLNEQTNSNGQNNGQVNTGGHNTQLPARQISSQQQFQNVVPVRVPEVLHYIPSPDLSTGRPPNFLVLSETFGKSTDPTQGESLNQNQQAAPERNFEPSFQPGPLTVSSLSPNRSPVFINSTIYFATTASPDVFGRNLLRPRQRVPDSSNANNGVDQQNESPSDAESGEEEANQDANRSSIRIPESENTLDLEANNVRENTRDRNSQNQGIGTASLGSSGHIPSKPKDVPIPGFFSTTPTPLQAARKKTARPTVTTPTTPQPLQSHLPTTQATRLPFVKRPSHLPPFGSTGSGRLSQFPVSSPNLLHNFGRTIPTTTGPSRFPPTSGLLRTHPTTLPPIHLQSTTSNLPGTTSITQVFNRELVGSPNNFFQSSGEVTPRGRQLNSKPPPIIVTNPPIHLTTVLPPLGVLGSAHRGAFRPEDVVPTLHHGPPLIPTSRSTSFPRSLRFRTYRHGVNTRS